MLLPPTGRATECRLSWRRHGQRSGRVDAYLLYMLNALDAIIAAARPWLIGAGGRQAILA